MPNEYRLSYPCDLFVTVEADSLSEAKQKLIDCLEPLMGQSVIVCLDTPDDWKYDPAERLFPRGDADGPILDLVTLEDGPDDEDEMELTDHNRDLGEAGA